MTVIKEWFTTFLIKNPLRLINLVNEPNYQLENEVHKPIIRKFKKIIVYLSFRDNIWGFDLADMQSLRIYSAQLICLVNMLGLFL